MGNVLFEKKGLVGIVTINRPKALNALNTETLEELHGLFTKIREEKDVRVIILTGSGEKSFIAGADIAQMSELEPKDAREMCLLARELFSIFEKMPQVIIAAVNGYALGGGCETAMACDIRIAAENAIFAQPETGLGIIPGFGGTQRLTRLVGKGIAKEMIFTCCQIDAKRAYEIGLVNKVVKKEELMDEAMKMANKILSNGSLAISYAKNAIDAGVNMDLEDSILLEANSFATTFTTYDKKEGMSAFLERRKANLKDF